MRWGQLTKSRSFAWWTPYGDTFEEANANYGKQAAGVNPDGSGGSTSGWEMEDLLKVQKQARAINRSERRRRKP